MMNNKNLIIILIDKISLINFSIHPFMIKNFERIRSRRNTPQHNEDYR